MTRVSLLVMLLLVAVSCAPSDDLAETFTTPTIITLEIDGYKVDGKYVARVVDGAPSVVLHIDVIEGFDHIFRVGTIFKIRVKKYTSKKTGVTRYVFIEKL
ncbi:MAG: hypothetical protein Q4D93_03850 [Porphyromonas sp.]|nr:hypothetical protein [Porphyromonas sp.]